MKLNFDKVKIINKLLYIAFVIFYIITLTLFNMGNPISRYRYFILALSIIVRIYNYNYEDN